MSTLSQHFRVQIRKTTNIFQTDKSSSLVLAVFEVPQKVVKVIKVSCVAGRRWTQMQNSNIKGLKKGAALFGCKHQNTTNKKTKSKLEDLKTGMTGKTTPLQRTMQQQAEGNKGLKYAEG